MVKRGIQQHYQIVIYLFIVLLLLSACVPKIEKLVEEGDTETLIKLLGYKMKADVRAEAAQALGEMGLDEAVDPLLERLSDKNESVRAAAAVALGSIGDESVIPALINQLNDESEIARNGATQALVMFGAKAVDPVIGFLTSPGAAFKDELVNVLLEIGLPAIPSLVAALNDSVENIRQSAYETLVAMGSLSADYLISNYPDIDRRVQPTVEDVLVEMEMEAVDALIEELDNQDQIIATMTHKVLVTMGEPAIQTLIDALQDESLVWLVEDVLVEIGDPAVAELIDVLSDPDVQTQAGDVLIQMEEVAIDDLIAAYQSDPAGYAVILRPLVYGLRLEDIDIRDEVNTILVDIGEDAVPDILAMAKNSNKVVVGGETYFAHDVQYSPFGTVRGTLINGDLCEDTVNSEGGVVLCQRGENYFVDKVMAVQEGGGSGAIIYNNVEGILYPTIGEDNEVEIVSVGMTMEQGLELLDFAIGKEVQVVGEDVSQVPFTLADIGTSAIPYIFESFQNEELIDIGEDALIEMGSSAVPALLAALDEEEASVLVEVIYVMGEINDASFHEPVIEALEHNDPLVREAAGYALAKMDLEESIEPLIGRLLDEDEYSANAAEYALTAIGLPAVEPLLAAYHEDDYVLSNIVEDILRDIFEDNSAVIEEMAADVCSGVAQPDASTYSRYESEFHPLVVAYEDGDLHYWTDYLPVDWLPYTPEDLELVACVSSQEKQAVQVCQYYYTGSGASAPSITRYRYEVTAKLFAAQTGYLVGSTTLRGTSPDYCPYTTTSSTTQITGDYVTMDDFRTWVSVYGIDLED